MKKVIVSILFLFICLCLLLVDSIFNFKLNGFLTFIFIILALFGLVYVLFQIVKLFMFKIKNRTKESKVESNSNKKNQFKILIGLSICSLLILSLTTYNFITFHQRNLNKFSSNLFNSPLPSNTTVLEKVKFGGKNWVDRGGSGGYWNVVATMKLSTSLSKNEIIDYYSKIKYPYSKTNESNGVESELYFEGDLKKEIFDEGSYYRSKDGYINEVSSYKKINEGKESKYVFIIQIIDAYDYPWKID